MKEKPKPKRLYQDELSPADLVGIWKTRALLIAAISPTPDPVAEFLKKKHIPRHEASVAAILIWNEAQKARIKSSIPRFMVCLYFICFGIALVVTGLFTHLLLLGVGAFFIVIPGAVLLGDFVDRR